jgi:hypothetical protein
MAMQRNMMIHRYQFSWNESPPTQRRRTAYKLVTACLEGRCSQDHHSLGTNGLYRLIGRCFLVLTLARQKFSRAYLHLLAKVFTWCCSKYSQGFASTSILSYLSVLKQHTFALFLSSQRKDPENHCFSLLFKLPFKRGNITWCGDLNRFTRKPAGVPHLSALALHISLIASQVPAARRIGGSLDVDSLSNGIRWQCL